MIRNLERKRDCSSTGRVYLGKYPEYYIDGAAFIAGNRNRLHDLLPYLLGFTVVVEMYGDLLREAVPEASL